MSAVLNADQRRHLDAAIQRARTAAERAAADALGALSVAEPTRPSYLKDDDNALRLALREKARQLGDDTAGSGADLTNLKREVAYEQWHRLLFARFLEVNGLLRHPEFRDTSLTLDDCSDLADDLDEPDGWSVAARFAAEILPGVFRLDDPAVQVRFAAEHRLDLEKILLSLPSEVFVTEDALGWVYQFWQTAEKKRVNESGVKIGGADLSPVTQLFTENYMVRFLLENSLGAWWAARHPDSPLVDNWDYLRRLDDGTPAAGTFDEWPAAAAEVTVMDPCCGSGHFLVAMFGMLWRMRAEEEGLSPADAQDAVLRDNLHGLELDPRCTQIATFNVALESWKQGGFRDLPAPQVACSGVPARTPLAEWTRAAGSDIQLESALKRLHGLFSNAESLGSLIDPVRAAEDAGLESVEFDQVVAPLKAAIARDLAASGSGTAAVVGAALSDVVHAAELLGRKYVLVATNVPYLTGKRQVPALFSYVESELELGKADLSTAFLQRIATMASHAYVAVTPENWLNLTSYTRLRQSILKRQKLTLLARLGPGAFREISGEVVKVILLGASTRRVPEAASFLAIDTAAGGTVESKAEILRTGDAVERSQAEQLQNPDARILLVTLPKGRPLSAVAESWAGIQTGDYPRFGRKFWEVAELEKSWELQQSTVSTTIAHGGREHMLLWEGGSGQLEEHARLNRERLHDSHRRGSGAWHRPGVVVSSMGDLPVTLYTGELFDSNVAVLSPYDERMLPAVWHFCASDSFRTLVRTIDNKMNVTNRTFAKVPFDVEHWSAVAEAAGPLPHPATTDPTQWIFDGHVASADGPLQVALAQLLGYVWPIQEASALDRVDADGIASLQSLPGEADLATRLRELLAEAFGSAWSSTLERRLVAEAGGKNGRLEDWLRDTFFAQHVRIFHNRPFLWHIWDGRKDGFSAILNYHRLDHKALEKLTYTSLGAWIERQRHETAASRAGADARLAAAEALQAKLKLILDGATPYDIYVRWKGLHRQPIGWNPDLDDGVRLNIRPFVTAGVLRSKVNVHWKKDRGANADGSERLNDLHPTLEERREARREAGAEA